MRGLGFDLDSFPCVGFRRWVWLSGMDIIFKENTPQSIFHECYSSLPYGCSELLVKQWHKDSVLHLSLSPSQTNQQMATFASFLTHCQCPQSCHSCLWWGLENVHILQTDRDFHISYTLLLSQKGNGAWNVSLFLGFVWHRLNNAQRHFWIISCGSRNLVRNRPLLVQMLRSSQLTIHCE